MDENKTELKQNISEILISALKVIGYYFVFVLMGFLMAGPVFTLASFGSMGWFMFYVGLLLFLYTLYLFSKLNTLAKKDVRNHKWASNFKGLWIGLIAEIPFIIVMVLYVACGWKDIPLNNFVYLLVMGLYSAFHIKFYSSFPYILVLFALHIPLACFLSYWSGLKNFDPAAFLRKLIYVNADKADKKAK